MSEEIALVPWDDERLGGADCLGYQKLGKTFTNLIKSIEDTRVISIEAGFGHGKTYFRKNWAQHLRNEGEVVIEIDAMLSDHSGEPVVTFLGAMLEQIEVANKSGMKDAKKALSKIGGTVFRAAGKAVLREGMDELLTGLEDITDNDGLNNIIEGVGDDLGKVAVGMVSAQMATERARKNLRTQLESLRDLLTKGKDTKRVVVIVDELDRCHPEYAIALLEAMKVVFNLDGFVFCLMVNPKHLEQIASRRFGIDGEDYVDKFIDLRLQLRADKDARGIAARDYVLALPDYIPFGEGHEFSKERAAEVAEKIVIQNADGGAPITMRQIKRAIDRVALALAGYTKKPLDLPLLVYLALLLPEHGRVSEMKPHECSALASQFGLNRAHLTPSKASQILTEISARRKRSHESTHVRTYSDVSAQFQVDLSLFAHALKRPLSRETPNKVFGEIFEILEGILPDYIPDHEAMLNASLAIIAD